MEHIKRRGDLAKHFAQLGFTKGAEVGVADGRFSEYLCKVIPHLQLICVDPWEKYPDNKRYRGYSRRDGNRPNEELARERMDPYNAMMLKEFSMDAVRNIPIDSLDFVYIDAHHDFDYVMQDIIEWSKRVKKGGIISGHDYYDFISSGVKEAVDVYMVAHKIPNLYLTQEKEPSWYFVKT